VTAKTQLFIRANLVPRGWNQRESGRTITRAITLVSLSCTLLEDGTNPPVFRSDNLARHSLARQMANQPSDVLESLVRVAVDPCRVGTEPISLLRGTPSGEQVYAGWPWPVLAKPARVAPVRRPWLFSICRQRRVTA
jgi:hypothetical protein